MYEMNHVTSPSHNGKDEKILCAIRSEIKVMANKRQKKDKIFNC
jgi:hypothetical protein